MLILQIQMDRVYWGNSLESYLIALGIIIGVALVGHLIKIFLLRSLTTWAVKSETKLDDFLIDSFGRTLIPLFYILGLYAGLSHLSFMPNVEKAIEIITKILMTYLIVRIISSTISFLMASYLRKQERGEEKLRQTRGIMLMINVVIWIFGLVFLLANLGYDVTAIVAGLGIGGIAIALAAQTILGDLFAYFVIFFDRPFEVGDFIVVDDKSGTVNEIGLKTTRVNAIGGEELIFSNTDLTSSRLHNYKAMQRRRVVFKLGVVYETSANHVKYIPEALTAVVKKQKDIVFDRAHFAGYSNTSLDFEVCYFVMGGNFNKYMDIQQAINTEIFEDFSKKGIRFAYPTQTLLQPFVSNDPDGKNGPDSENEPRKENDPADSKQAD